MLLPSYYMKTFRYPPQALKRSKCHLADSTKRVFKNSSMKSKVQLCEKNAHITKQFVRVLLSSCYVKIFPFPSEASSHCKYPLGDSTDRVFQSCSVKRKVQLCELNAHIPKEFVTMLLSSLYVKIFPFPPQASKQSKGPLSNSTKSVFQNCSMKSKVQLCEMNVHITKKFVRTLLSSFIVKLFPFPPEASKRSKCPLADFIKILFQSCSVKRTVQLCETNAHITKKFVRILLSSYYVKIFRYPPEASKPSKYPPADSTKRVFQNCSMKSKDQLCEMNAHITKKFARMLLSSFQVEIFPFPPQASKRFKCSHANSTKRGFQSCSIKRKVQLCEMNAHIRKKFVRRLPSSFYVNIFLFRPQASKRFKCPLADSTKSVSKWLN